MHRLLLRQLRREGLSPHSHPPEDSEQWRRFLVHIDRAYREHDQDRYTLERSLKISSEEMQTLFEALKKSSEGQLGRARARLRSLIDSIPDLIVFRDVDGACLGCNKAFEAFAGRREEQLIGSRDRHLVPARPVPETIPGDRRSPPGHNEQWIRHPDGHEILVETIETPYCNSDGVVIGVIHVSRDITERKQAEDQLSHQARHDSLTGLPNRLQLDELLAHAINNARRGKTIAALLFFDLDRFKNINDTLGHPAGDEVLRLMARRLQIELRDCDILGRLGGDEYVVLLENLAAPRQSAQVAAKLVSALAMPFTLEQREMSLSISLGISVYPEDGEDATTLMKNADAAMYLAKEQGGNGYQFYTPELTAKAQRFLAMEASLRQAISGDELVLHYQPKIDLGSGGIIGAEALLRWNHPERGLIGPLEFISLAEETGLIIPIGEWVLYQACIQLQTWKGLGMPIREVAVNLSAPQLVNEEFVGSVRRIIDKTGINPAMLKLEIAETALMTHAERATSILNELKALGLCLSIDSFGTGYSSMSYLKHFPIDELKIDRSFIRQIPGNSDDTEIAKAIIALGRSLHLDVVAVGVETLEQQLFLTLQQCTRVQGHLYSAPVTAQRFQGFF